MLILFLPSPKCSLSKKNKRRAITVCLMLLSLCALFFSYFNRRLSPLLIALSHERATALAEQAVNDAAKEVLTKEGNDMLPFYESCVNGILILEGDTAAANRLRTQLSDALLERLGREEYTSFPIPIGNLLFGELLSGRGPKIHVRFVPASSATVTLREDFRGAGINQTLFTLTAEVNVRVKLLFPGGSELVTLSVECPLKELILAGQVPDVYLDRHG